MTGGAVLCGGASRRMGRDKALIDIGGVPMAERIAGVLAGAGCDPVVFVGGDAERLGATGRAVVADRWPGEGPAGGVITALATLSEVGADTVAVVACDVPDLVPDAVRAVLAAHPGHDVAVAESDRLQPLVACWSATALPKIESLFGAGVRSMHDIVAALDAVLVPLDAVVLRNVNTPDDLAD